VVLFLLLVIVAIALGIIGIVAEGLLYLLAIGVVIFIVALVIGALKFRRGGRQPGR
jgi:hypothetical protein